MTAAELGQRLGGLSARSARRYWAEPRENYEGESKTNSAPWAQDEGVSRATWYRRQKRRYEQTKHESCEPKDKDCGPMRTSTNSLMKPNEPDLEKDYRSIRTHRHRRGRQAAGRYLLYVTMVKGLRAAIAEADRLEEEERKGPMTSTEVISAMASAVTSVLEGFHLEKKDFLLEVLFPHGSHDR